MATHNIGWIGLGIMGIPLAQKFVHAGHAVTVYNRSKDKAKDLSALGANTAESPVQLARQSDVIFLMVSDDQATCDIFTGEQGLLRAPVSGKIFVNMSTVSPGISQEIARLCQEQQNYYLD